MLAKHLDTLRLLFPLEMDGEHDPDQILEARQLDRAQGNGEALRVEMFPDGAEALLSAWERVCDIAAAEDEPLQYRRDNVVRKLRERGGLSIPYFLGLAQALGYIAEIVEPMPFMAGWGAAGDELFEDTIIYQWGLEIYNQPVYKFRAGDSAAGETLTWWNSQTYLEALVKELKPAHTDVYFSYIEG